MLSGIFCLEHRFICWSEWLEGDFLFVMLAAKDDYLPRYVLVSSPSIEHSDTHYVIDHLSH